MKIAITIIAVIVVSGIIVTAVPANTSALLISTRLKYGGRDSKGLNQNSLKET
jgi:hypothetical protein